MAYTTEELVALLEQAKDRLAAAQAPDDQQLIAEIENAVSVSREPDPAPDMQPIVFLSPPDLEGRSGFQVVHARTREVIRVELDDGTVVQGIFSYRGE